MFGCRKLHLSYISDFKAGIFLKAEKVQEQMDTVVVTWCPAEGRCEVAGLMAINSSLFRGISWCCRQNVQTVFLPCLACSSLLEDRDGQEANVSPCPHITIHSD